MPENSSLEIESLVREAAFFVEAQGEDAFPMFRTKGRFLYGDIYVFVWIVKGKRIIGLVFPPNNMGEISSSHALLNNSSQMRRKA